MVAQCFVSLAGFDSPPALELPDAGSPLPLPDYDGPGAMEVGEDGAAPDAADMDIERRVPYMSRGLSLDARHVIWLLLYLRSVRRCSLCQTKSVRRQGALRRIIN